MGLDTKKVEWGTQPRRPLHDKLRVADRPNQSRLILKRKHIRDSALRLGLEYPARQP